ncbi:MAG: HAMP domain-containing protein [Verrucomicrobiaceae bacterium]|nr:HAMP domain-containing protein [Verrucomicrobiaceae bacterium]
MTRPSSTRSFRVRLALQTIFVAGALVAAFGAAAWWHASRTLERSVDARITAQAQRVWNRIDPRTTVEDFQAVSDAVFSPVTGEAPAVMVVKEHVLGTTIYTTQGAPADLDAYFRSAFPTEQELLDAPPMPGEPNPEAGRRPPAPPRDRDDFGDLLGLPELEPKPAKGQQRNRGVRFRPQMPMVRDPLMFNARSGGVDWRWGAFSNPHYTMFVGISLDELHGETNRMAVWYAGAGFIGLTLAGVGALWTSKRAMRPLERVVATAQRLTASDLAERIPLSRDDDREFAQLIAVLNGMMERLEASFQQAVRFTADASHELKTPLAVMLASLDDALRHTAPGSAEHERFASLFEEAARLKTITQSLLLLSQADAGRLPTRPETYDLSADLSRLLEDGEILCEAAALTLRSDIQPGIFIHADRALVHQIHQNLLSNAIKYNRPDGQVELSLARDEGHAVFTIRNTGPAIPADIQPRLFERFFRGDKAHNRQTDGFGLGLNIAAEFARASHATLRLVGSREDETVFELRIPAQ